MSNDLKELVSDKIQEAAVISSGVEDVWQWPSGWDVTIELAAEEIVAMVRQHDKANRTHLTVRLKEDHMADSERAKIADVIETELDSYCPSPFNGAFAVSLMQSIDRLLTDRDATRREPAADAVEAAEVEVAWLNSQLERFARVAMLGALAIEQVPASWLPAATVTAIEKWSHTWRTTLTSKDMVYAREVMGIPEPEQEQP